MTTLHVRNVPDELYRRIQALAEAEIARSPPEVIQLLNQGLHAHEARQDAAVLIDRIQQRSRTVQLPKGWTDSAELIREDRSR